MIYKPAFCYGIVLSAHAANFRYNVSVDPARGNLVIEETLRHDLHAPFMKHVGLYRLLSQVVAVVVGMITSRYDVCGV